VASSRRGAVEAAAVEVEAATARGRDCGRKKATLTMGNDKMDIKKQAIHNERWHCGEMLEP